MRTNQADMWTDIARVTYWIFSFLEQFRQVLKKEPVPSDSKKREESNQIIGLIKISKVVKGMFYLSASRRRRIY